MTARPGRDQQGPAPQGALGRAKHRLSGPPKRGEAGRIVGAFAISALALAAIAVIDAASVPPGPGSSHAPAFTIDTTSGGTYAIASDLGLRPVFLEFMHPSCSHCQAVAPTLLTAHSEFGARVRFVTVAMRLGTFPDPTPATVAAFAADHGHGWTYGLDRANAASVAYGVQGTPHFVFIAANGTIVSQWPGEIGLAELRAELSAIAGG